MKQLNLANMCIDELLTRFVEIGLAQDAALEDDDLAKYNRLYNGMDAIRLELKARGKDARLTLTRLYSHPNAQVRFKAAVCSYVVAPEAARACLQAIRDSKMPPQYLDAGMTLRAIDNGTSMLD